MLRFKEKGGKEKKLPVHHKLEEILDQYLKFKATGLKKEPASPFFRRLSEKAYMKLPGMLLQVSDPRAFYDAHNFRSRVLATSGLNEPTHSAK
jgi:hypothetical protein